MKWMVVFLCLVVVLTVGCDHDDGGQSSGSGGSDNGSGGGSTQPIPAPGAIVLAAVGTAAVGWLRRKRWV